MNKNGYTLVELLATVVIVALLSGLATISYTSYIDRSNEQVFSTYQDTMHAEATIYFLKNSGSIPKGSEKVRLSLSDIGIEDIKNPINSSDKCTQSYVEVARRANTNIISLSYEVCLKCNDYDNCKTYID